MGDNGSGAPTTVTFKILPEGFLHGMMVNVSSTIDQISTQLSGELRLAKEDIRLVYKDAQLAMESTLAEFGIKVGQEGVVIDVLTVDLPEAPTYNIPDEIDVEVRFDNGETRRIRVGIDKFKGKKHYLGGFRNKKTEKVYHHASAQTDPERKNFSDASTKAHRTTQTCFIKTRSSQTGRENGTQMQRNDLYMDDTNDKVLLPRRYFRSDALFELRLQKTVIIQCYWRGYVARKRAWSLREQLYEKQEAARSNELRQQEESENRHKREIERRIHPRSFQDFEILYNELENWRQHETLRINNSGLKERERLASLAQLLHKETKLLQTIDRLKIASNKENREDRIKTMLNLMSAAKQWELSDGEVAEVHTPFTTRAKELLELFNGLNLPLLTIDERLDVLLHVKWTVKEFDCNLTRELVDLIDREADLLNRGRGEKSLEGLRKRISNLFLQFVETPEFNPEASRFQKVPQDLILRPNVQPISGDV